MRHVNANDAELLEKIIDKVSRIDGKYVRALLVINSLATLMDGKNQAQSITFANVANTFCDLLNADVEEFVTDLKAVAEVLSHYVNEVDK